MSLTAANAAHPPRSLMRALDRRTLVAAALTVLSGGLLAASYSLHPIWWAAWLAPAPVLAAALTASRRGSYGLGAAAGLIGGFTTLSYYGLVAGWPIACLILVLRAAGWGGAVRASTSAAQRWPAAVSVFVLPLTWTAIETLLLYLSPHSSAGSYGYSQMAALPVIQIAALGGVPAIVFVVLSAGALAGLVLGRMLEGERRWRGLPLAAALVAALVAGSLGYGALRLAGPRDPLGPQAAMIVTDQFAKGPRIWARVWAAYGPAAEAAASPGGYVVLPEKIAIASPAEADAAAADLADVARRHGATLVAGIEVKYAPHAYRNRAAVAGPDGQVLWYDKQHLVPGGERRDIPGHTPLARLMSGLQTGVAICKDMHFPQLGRTYAGLGARVMLVPAWDFVRDGWMSDRLTALRGVEEGFSIVRTSREGVSSVSDRFGRITAQVVSGPQIAVLRAQVPLAPGRSTLYGTIGDVFGWLAVAAALAVLAVLRLAAPLSAWLSDRSRRQS